MLKKRTYNYREDTVRDSRGKSSLYDRDYVKKEH